MSDNGIVPLSICNEYVMPLLNKCWPESFGNIDKAKRAIIERGWFLANQALLDHPEIKKNMAIATTPQPTTAAETPTESTTVDASVVETCNLKSAFSSTIMDRLLGAHLRNEGIQKRQENLKHGDQVKKFFAEAKDLTSGRLVAHGVHSLNDQRVLEFAKKNKLAKEKAALEQEKKDNEKLISKINKMKKVRDAKWQEYNTYNNKELKVFIQYKKRKNDPPMPNKKGAEQKLLLFTMAKEYSGRESPVLPSLSSDAAVDNSIVNDLSKVKEAELLLQLNQEPDYDLGIFEVGRFWKEWFFILNLTKIPVEICTGSTVYGCRN